MITFASVVSLGLLALAIITQKAALFAMFAVWSLTFGGAIWMDWSIKKHNEGLKK